MNKLQNIKANSLKYSMLSRFLLLFSLMLNIVFFLELISGLQSLEKWSELIVTYFPLPFPSLPIPSHCSFFFSPFSPNFFAPNMFQCLLCTWHIDVECLGFKGEKNAGSSESSSGRPRTANPTYLCQKVLRAQARHRDNRDTGESFSEEVTFELILKDR